MIALKYSEGDANDKFKLPLCIHIIMFILIYIFG